MTTSPHFFERWYRPATMVVTAAGRLEHDADRRRRCAPGSAMAPAASCPTRTPPAAPRRARRSWSATTPSRRTCASGGAASPPATTTAGRMSVANQVLGGGMASRLFQEVREERGLAYSVYSHPTAFEDSGYLTIYCGTAPKRAREALEVIDDVVASVLADGITEQRAGRRGRLPRGLDAPRARGQRRPHGPARPQPHAARSDHHDRRARRPPPRRHHRRRVPRAPPRARRAPRAGRRRARSRPTSCVG